MKAPLSASPISLSAVSRSLQQPLVSPLHLNKDLPPLPPPSPPTNDKTSGSSALESGKLARWRETAQKYKKQLTRKNTWSPGTSIAKKTAHLESRLRRNKSLPRVGLKRNDERVPHHSRLRRRGTAGANPRPPRRSSSLHRAASLNDLSKGSRHSLPKMASVVSTPADAWNERAAVPPPPVFEFSPKASSALLRERSLNRQQSGERPLFLAHAPFLYKQSETVPDTMSIPESTSIPKDIIMERSDTPSTDSEYTFAEPFAGQSVFDWEEEGRLGKKMMIPRTVPPSPPRAPRPAEELRREDIVLEAIPADRKSKRPPLLKGNSYSIKHKFRSVRNSMMIMSSKEVSKDMPSTSQGTQTSRAHRARTMDTSYKPARTSEVTDYSKQTSSSRESLTTSQGRASTSSAVSAPSSASLRTLSDGRGHRASRQSIANLYAALGFDPMEATHSPLAKAVEVKEDNLLTLTRHKSNHSDADSTATPIRRVRSGEHPATNKGRRSPPPTRRQKSNRGASYGSGLTKRNDIGAKKPLTLRELRRAHSVIYARADASQGTEVEVLNMIGAVQGQTIPVSDSDASKFKEDFNEKPLPAKKRSDQLGTRASFKSRHSEVKSQRAPLNTDKLLPIVPMLYNAASPASIYSQPTASPAYTFVSPPAHEQELEVPSSELPVLRPDADERSRKSQLAIGRRTGWVYMSPKRLSDQVEGAQSSPPLDGKKRPSTASIDEPNTPVPAGPQPTQYASGNALGLVDPDDDWSKTFEAAGQHSSESSTSMDRSSTSTINKERVRRSRHATSTRRARLAVQVPKAIPEAERAMSSTSPISPQSPMFGVPASDRQSDLNRTFGSSSHSYLNETYATDTSALEAVIHEGKAERLEAASSRKIDVGGWTKSVIEDEEAEEAATPVEPQPMQPKQRRKLQPQIPSRRSSDLQGGPRGLWMPSTRARQLTHQEEPEEAVPSPISKRSSISDESFAWLVPHVRDAPSRETTPQLAQFKKLVETQGSPESQTAEMTKSCPERHARRQLARIQAYAVKKRSDPLMHARLALAGYGSVSTDKPVPVPKPPVRDPATGDLVKKSPKAAPIEPLRISKSQTNSDSESPYRAPIALSAAKENRAFNQLRLYLGPGSPQLVTEQGKYKPSPACNSSPSSDSDTYIPRPPRPLRRSPSSAKRAAFPKTVQFAPQQSGLSVQT